MLQKSKTILFFGTEDFSSHTLEALIESDFTVGAIITKPDTLRGRGKQLVKPRVKEIGEAHDIPVWQPAKLADIAADIASFHEPLGVLVSFGKIIPQSIIDLFSPGIINLHPSLLPKYRGPSPIESAILHGDDETAISIMQLSARMDAGPVYLQETIPLTGNETAPELYSSLGRRGAQLLVAALPQIIDGTLPAAPQDENNATYCQLIKKSDGLVDWHKPAEQIEREVRAYLGWPGSRTTLGSIDVIITSAFSETVSTAHTTTPGEISVISEQGVSILLVGASDTWLSIEKIKPVGKKEMPVQAFLAGYKDKLFN